MIFHVNKLQHRRTSPTGDQNFAAVDTCNSKSKTCIQLDSPADRSAFVGSALQCSAVQCGARCGAARRGGAVQCNLTDQVVGIVVNLQQSVELSVLVRLLARHLFVLYFVNNFLFAVHSLHIIRSFEQDIFILLLFAFAI